MSDVPPWQVRVVAAAAMVGSLVGLAVWGMGGFIGVALVGGVLVLAIDNWLRPRPDSVAAFAVKTLAVIAAIAAIAVGTGQLMERIRPLWLGVTLGLAYLFGWLLLIRRFIRREEEKAALKDQG